MFNISTKGDYGLSIMIYLAQNLSQNYISIKEISEAENLPQLYLAQLMLKLKRKGFIESKEGKNGGYRLAKNPEEISILEIIVCLEGPVSLVKCLSPDYKGGCKKCEDKCKSKKVWNLLLVDIQEYLRGISLKDLIVRIS